MSWIPPTVDKLLDAALVAEVTVIGRNGEPITHPLIPLWDGEHIYVTSSVLFSKKVEHVKRNHRVAVAITDPVGTRGDTARCSIQGDAKVYEEDPHETWERVLPLWEAKEPAIKEFLSKRFALPLFFERSLIEITPTKVAWWEDGRPEQAPQTVSAPEVAA